MTEEMYPLITAAQIGGFLLFGLGLLLTFMATASKWTQRAAYLVAAPGFLLIWGSGHMGSLHFWERDLFSLSNIVIFLVLVVLMNLAHRKAALSGQQGVLREEKRAKGFSLRHFGAIEAGSLILLMFVAMPLKYIWEQDLAVRYVGMVHGILFMVFVVWVFVVAIQKKWAPEKTLGALVASVIPFGPFVADLAE